MNEHSRAPWALALFLTTVSACLMALPGLLDSIGDATAVWGFHGSGTVAGMVFASCGVLLGLKQPKNPIGWLFGLVGLAFSLITLGETYAIPMLIRGDDGGIVYQVVWLTSWVWIVFLGLIAYSILLFPTGTLPSPRWRVPARFIPVGFALACVSFAFAAGPLTNAPSQVNRYALDFSAFDAFSMFGLLAFNLALVASAVGVVQRFRNSHGVQRQQMKLFAFAAATMAITMLLLPVAIMLGEGAADVMEIINSLTTMSIPIAMAVAIMRYKLYDLDLFINRALVYGTLTTVLGAFYFGTVVLLQEALSPVTEESDLAIAASTLAVAALFRPLSARIQRFIDRRFYRNKYNSGATLEVFSTRLRDEIDIDTLKEEVLSVVGATIQPRHAGLWLPVQESVTSGADE